MNYSDAVKEAYATARRSDPVFETLEVSHSSSPVSRYIIKNNEDRELPLVDGGPLVTFQASGLDLKLAGQTKSGLQAMDVAIGNTQLATSDFLKEAIKTPNEPIVLKYRIYLLSDLTKPHNDPPLISYLSGAKITSYQVSGSATFADIVNKAFLTELYTLNSNPAL